jgi:tetratricopeptide (TPR) repeat protein
MTFRVTRGFLFRVSLLVLAGLLVACGKPAPAPPVLEVEYAGCWAFYLPDQVCSLVPERELTLWVRTTPPDRKVELHAGGRPLKPQKEEKVSGGRRYQLSIPKPADRLTVEVLSPDGSRGPIWFLRLAEPEQPSWWKEVKELIDSNESLKAQRRLEQIQSSAPRGERSFTWLPLANLAHREGDDEKEELYLKEGIAADRSENRWSGLATKEPRLAALHIKSGSFGEARRILQTLKLPPKAAANDKCNVSFYQGVLAEKTSNYDAALKRLQETADLAQRVGLSKFEGAAGQMLALVYQQLGRSRDAARLYAKQAALDLKSSCDLGTFWTNAGWFQLMEREAGNTVENPAPALQNALAEFQKNQCSPEQILTSHQNLALAYQQQGQWSEASRELAQAQALAKHSNLLELLWQEDLEARMALHDGHPELALDLYEKLEKRAERAASPAGLLQALLGRAKAHIASGQQQEAINVLAKADRQIEEQSRHIPVHEGLDTFFAYQEAATRLYLELLLERGQQQKAFDLARKSRSRLLRQLAVRDRLRQLDPERRKAWLDSLSKYNTLREAVESDAAKRWQLAVSEKESALAAEAKKLKEAQDDLDLALRDLDALRRNGEEKLAPPATGEVILAYHPLPGKLWAAFAATERELVGATFELPETLPADLEQRARLLLRPSPSFQAAIASPTVTSVKILPYGPLRSVDFHALPFNGQPLLATKLVSYSLDLPVRSASALRSGQKEALVVSNPTRDLRTAETEGETVAAAIRRWRDSWTLTHLKGNEAKSNTVSEALKRASFFHYAGHGIFGGFAGWSSELPLADQSRLTLSDVLTLSHTPDSIVLSACDAGRTSEEAPGEGVGLANAFLLAGAREVVAARELVPDASANELMAEMYRHWQPGEDLPHQLRRAQLACSRMNPSPCPSWASFRLLVP